MDDCGCAEAVRIELWWDEDQQPVVRFSAPDEEELDDRYYPEGLLVDLEALVMAEQDLLWREPPAIPQFAHAIFDFLSSYFPENPSFHDPLYDEWHELSTCVAIVVSFFSDFPLCLSLLFLRFSDSFSFEYIG